MWVANTIIIFRDFLVNPSELLSQLNSSARTAEMSKPAIILTGNINMREHWSVNCTGSKVL